MLISEYLGLVQLVYSRLIDRAAWLVTSYKFGAAFFAWCRPEVQELLQKLCSDMFTERPEDALDYIAQYVCLHGPRVHDHGHPSHVRKTQACNVRTACTSA